VIQTFQTGSARWVVSENEGWLPGVYDSDATARRAAALPDAALRDLARIYSIDGEDRPVTAADLDALPDA